MPRLEPHPLAEMLPMMNDAEYASLKADMAVNGQVDKAKSYQGKLLDGRNRAKACEELGLKLDVEPFKGTYEQAFNYVLSKANHRHLSDSQKACVAATFLDTYEADRAGGKISTTGKSRDHASMLFGVNERYVQDAKLLRKAAPKSFRDVFEGRTKIAVAARDVRRKAKEKELSKLAKAHAKQAAGSTSWQVIVGDAVEELEQIPGATIDLVAIDPPYNEAIDYGNGAKSDDLPEPEYLQLMQMAIVELHRVLKPNGSIYVIISGRYQTVFETMLTAAGFHRRNAIAWVETFGVHQSGNFSNCWRPILYYTKHPKHFTWHGDQILIPSDRQTKHNDPRANPAGKVPSNVWTEFPRLVDNAAERVPGFPTQIPQALMERIVLASSNPGDMVLDCFNGSGTTGAAAITHHRKYTGIERLHANAVKARARLTTVAAQVAAKGAE